MRQATTPSTVVFDIGGVLIDWNPRYLYRKLLPDADAVEHFLSTVCTSEWNVMQDAGRSWDDAVAELTVLHPDKTELIAAYHLRWDEMVSGAIDDTVEILRTLKAQGTPTYAITNFSADKFVRARRRFDFLNAFDGVTVSGEIGLIKPDARIYEHFLRSFGLEPADCVFIDDVAKNAQAARDVGMHAIHFTTPEALRAELDAFGILRG